jgi:undecaprenyl-diphosphatase
MSRFGAGIYALLAILFGLFGYFAHKLPYFPGDISISRWFQGITFLKPLMQATSYVSAPIPAIIIVALVAGGLWIWRKRLEAISVALSAGSATLISWLLKLLIDRPRPSHELVPILERTFGSSFPSLHATCALALGGLLFYLTPRLVRQVVLSGIVRSIIAIVVLLIGVSRIYLGVHWTSDVVGGLFLGGLILYPSISLYHNYVPRLKSGD